MTVRNGAQRAPRRVSSTRLVKVVVLAIFLSIGIAGTAPASTTAASGPKVAIIVGPNGSVTATNRAKANAIAREALRYTSNVVKVYSPNATWSRVKTALTGASIVIYLGRGYGFPSGHTSTLVKSAQDGFGLNPSAGRGNETTRYYGEAYIRTAKLAPKALVLLLPVAYASGGSEPGRAGPTLSIARRRVDNYGAGFLAAGASAVVAEINKSVPVYYVRSVFTRNATLDTIWRGAPTFHGHVTTFASSRTKGATGRTDPVRTSSGFSRSFVGWPSATAASVRASSATVTPASRPPTPAQTVKPATNAKTVTVSSIPALLAALADNSVNVIVVANGTYHISPSGQQASNSLWIGGDSFARRTRAITVQAQTRGGVVFDGGGGSGYSALSFEDGAHDQTWDGFTFANMRAAGSGIVEIGGYVPRRTPHHLTLRYITVTSSVRGAATSASGPATEHAFYISNAQSTGPHDILFEDITVDGRGGLASAVHFDHGDSANPNATNVTVRRLHVVGTQQAIIFWVPTVRNIVFDGVDISQPYKHAIRYESIGGSAVVLSNIRSTGSGEAPFYSSQGAQPSGVTFRNVSLR